MYVAIYVGYLAIGGIHACYSAPCVISRGQTAFFRFSLGWPQRKTEKRSGHARLHHVHVKCVLQNMKDKQLAIIAQFLCGR